MATGKLAQAIAYGAHIAMIKGNFDSALNIARELADKHPIELVNSLNPNRIEGQKTAAFEIVDEIGKAPELLYIPVGNAGNISAYWKGFKEYFELGFSTNFPELHGYQAEGASPLVTGKVFENPETVATAIRIGNPASWDNAITARDESGGLIDSVTDEEIISTYQLLAASEGVFCEPASASSLAGLIKEKKNGTDFQNKIIVCVVTGNGLKDPENAIKISPASYGEYQNDYQSVEKVLIN